MEMRSSSWRNNSAALLLLLDLEFVNTNFSRFLTNGDTKSGQRRSSYEAA
jgi:hypothetical protein